MSSSTDQPCDGNFGRKPVEELPRSILELAELRLDERSLT
jgi:hypothetical protein